MRRIFRSRSLETPARTYPKRERGASEAFILILMPTMLAFAGLAYDAGMAFNARRDATNVAAAAARAGANEVNPDALYTFNMPFLNSRDAENTARNFVQANGLKVLDTRVEGRMQVYVKVEAVHETTFLGIVGIGSLTVEAEARALAENRAR